ncbi:MAG: DoxX family protein [Actinomycetota bacterium]
MKALTMPRWRGSSDVALLAVRVGAGVLMAFHGWSKIDGGIAGPEGFEGFVTFLGLPLPGLLAYVVPFLELIGGIMILLGVLTRLPALLLAVEMVFTAFLVKLTKLDGVGYTTFSPDGPAPAEVDILFLVAFIAITLMGPGRYALDYVMGIERGEAEAPAVARARGARKVA